MIIYLLRKTFSSTARKSPSSLEYLIMSTSAADPLDLDIEIPSPTVCFPQFESDDVIQDNNHEQPRRSDESCIFIVSQSSIHSSSDRNIPSRQSAQDTDLSNAEYLARYTESDDNYLEPTKYTRNKHQDISHSRTPSTSRGYYYNQDSTSSTDGIILNPNSLDVSIPHSISVYADNGQFDLRKSSCVSYDNKLTDGKLSPFICHARSNLYNNGRRKESDNLDMLIPHTVSEFPERASNEDLVYRLLSDKISSDSKQPTYDNSNNKYDSVTVVNYSKDTGSYYLDVIIPSGGPDYLELDSGFADKNDKTRNDKTRNGSDSRGASKSFDDIIVVDSEFYCSGSGNEYAEVDPAAIHLDAYQYIQLDKMKNKSSRQSDQDVTDAGVVRPRDPRTIISTNMVTTPNVITPSNVITSSNVITQPISITPPVGLDEPATKHASSIKPEKLLRRILRSRRLLYVVIVVLLVITISAVIFIIYSQTRLSGNLGVVLNNSTRPTSTQPR